MLQSICQSSFIHDFSAYIFIHHQFSHIFAIWFEQPESPQTQKSRRKAKLEGPFADKRNTCRNKHSMSTTLCKDHPTWRWLVPLLVGLRC